LPLLQRPHNPRSPHSFPTRRSSDLLFLTDQTDIDLAGLELRHRHRAHVENRIRAAKDTGLRNLPCIDVVCNDTWLQLVLIAQDRSEEHTSELQSLTNLVCRLLLVKT